MRKEIQVLRTLEWCIDSVYSLGRLIDGFARVQAGARKDVLGGYIGDLLSRIFMYHTELHGKLSDAVSLLRELLDEEVEPRPEFGGAGNPDVVLKEEA